MRLQKVLYVDAVTRNTKITSMALISVTTVQLLSFTANV